MGFTLREKAPTFSRDSSLGQYIAGIRPNIPAFVKVFGQLSFLLREAQYSFQGEEVQQGR
jgi:hypothetical protein